jgi:biotin synthase
MELIHRAQTLHRQHHPADEVQLCTLMSIKTGGCPEDCGYCPQSAHFKTSVKKEPLFDVEEVLNTASKAKAMGATRFCMGAAWREVKDGPQFDSVLHMVRGVRDMGMEACVTLGMLEPHQAERLAEAGLTAYNHNLDTSEAHYEKIITTRTYADRLRTIDNVRKAGISVCCGGILGLGETVDDRCELLRTLANMNPQPESVPINQLVAVEGTPLEDQAAIEPLEMVRAIAVARILMPDSMVRLSAGREDMSQEAQVLCMMAGANSIFYGEELLTTPNPTCEDDKALLDAIGARPLQPAGL